MEEGLAEPIAIDKKSRHRDLPKNAQKSHLVPSLHRSNPERRVSHTTAITSGISAGHKQEADSVLLLRAMWRTAKVIAAVVCVWISNLCYSFTQCLILTANICRKHKIVSPNTFTFIHVGEVRSIETFLPISMSLLERTRWENKINGLYFILANQILIKLKEKLKSGQCEH